MFVLRTRRPQRYGKWIERAPGPEPEEHASNDPAIVLDGGLTEIEFDARDIPPREEDGGDSCGDQQP